MTLLLAALLMISVITNVFMAIAIRRSLIKVESYDDFFKVVNQTIKNTIKVMSDIDIRGSFQSDDEVGSVFEQMKGLVDSLDAFILENENEEE